MLKLYYMSDLHTETNGIHKFSQNKESYLVLIGDIGKPFESEYQETIADASLNFKLVFVVPGNNEYYSPEGKTMDEIDRQIQKICSGFDNVFYLNNTGFNLTPKLRIIGSILWSQIPEEKYLETTMLNQNCKTSKSSKVRCRDIYIQYKLVTPEDTNKFYSQNLEYLEKEIFDAKLHQIGLIVCTHYLPTKNLMNFSSIDYLFASDLDDLIHPPVIAWLSGHIHESKVEEINCVTVGLNCKGYGVKEFEPEEHLIITEI